MTLDYRTSKRLEQTFTRVDLLMAAIESLTKALGQAEDRITQLEDALQAIELKRAGKYGNRQRNLSAVD